MSQAQRVLPDFLSLPWHCTVSQRDVAFFSPVRVLRAFTFFAVSSINEAKTSYRVYLADKNSGHFMRKGVLQ